METKTIFGKEYCLHPDAPIGCSEKIIDAHTVQKGGSLSKIAENGQVISFIQELGRFMNTGLLKESLVPIKVASTFTGFCQVHDLKTFEPVENQPFQSSEHHTFLLGFRAISRELYMKTAALNIKEVLRKMDRGHNLSYQKAIQSYADLRQPGFDAGISDFLHAKNSFDAAYRMANFSDVYYYVIRFDRTPDIMCSGAFQPEHDFNGNQLQNLSDTNQTMDAITMSIIGTESGGAAVFSWVGKSQAATRFISSLDQYSDADLPACIVRLGFEQFENLYASPQWWTGLPLAGRSALSRRMFPIQPKTGSLKDLYRVSDPFRFRDDGLRPVLWNVTARNTNVSFTS